VIIVTGASGQLGRRIIRSLVDRLGPAHVGASVRDPSKADDLASTGVRVRHGDFAGPESLSDAFQGATQVLIVSSNARATGGDPLAQHRAAIDAAKAAGARRIVYTSHMAASATSAFAPMLDHAATEAMLREAGIAWTALRHGFYASTVPMLTRDAEKTEAIAAPQDGKVAWTAHADLAEAAAAILADEGRFDGPTPPLTATVASDLTDVAAMLTDLHGRAITRRVVSDEEYRSLLAQGGAPAGAAAMLVGLFQAARAGEFAATDPTLARLIDRPPTPLAEVLAAAIASRNDHQNDRSST
jgi:NAD(P)H dehydrogenase (quinone)